MIEHKEIKKDALPGERLLLVTIYLYLCNGMHEGKTSDQNIISDYTKVNHYSEEKGHFGFHRFLSFLWKSLTKQSLFR